MRKHKFPLEGKAFIIAAGLLAMASTSASAGQGSIASAVAKQAPCGTYTVTPGDTLGDIALRETGNRAAAEIIYRMNAGELSSPHEIAPGMRLAMPCGTDLSSGMAKRSTPDMSAGRWNASAGDFLVPVLTEWGTKAGYNVIVEHNSDWRFGVPFSSRGDFRDAVDEVLEGFGTAAVAPVVVFYTNKVMTIGVR